jgi:hypothetical protein
MYRYGTLLHEGGILENVTVHSENCFALFACVHILLARARYSHRIDALAASRARSNLIDHRAMRGLLLGSAR